MRNISIHVTCRPEKYIPVKRVLKKQTTPLTTSTATDQPREQVTVTTISLSTTTTGTILNSKNDTMYPYITPHSVGKSLAETNIDATGDKFNSLLMVPKKSDKPNRKGNRGIILPAGQNIVLGNTKPRVIVKDYDVVDTGTGIWEKIPSGVDDNKAVNEIIQPINEIIHQPINNKVNQLDKKKHSELINTFNKKVHQEKDGAHNDIKYTFNYKQGPSMYPNIRKYMNMRRRNHTELDLHGAHGASFIVETIPKTRQQDTHAINKEGMPYIFYSFTTKINTVYVIFPVYV